MRFFFRSRVPDTPRVLLIESGARTISEAVLPRLRSIWSSTPIDLLTCHPGSPAALHKLQSATCESPPVIYRVAEYRGSQGRKQLFRTLSARRYAIVAIVCSGESTMAKWKWLTVWKLPAKVLIVNENADCFWLDRPHFGTTLHLVRLRLGFSAIPSRTRPNRLALFAVLPFTLAYLLAYAAWVEVRRGFWLLIQRESHESDPSSEVWRP